MLREVIYNDTTSRDIISLNGLGVTKGESGGVFMMLIPGKEVAQDYSVFNYGPPRPHKNINPQDRTIVAGPGVKSATFFSSPRGQ